MSVEVQLRVEDGAHPGATFPIPDDGSVQWVGSSNAAHITLPDPAVAPRHAAVRLLGGKLQVVDLGAGASGVRVNDAPLPPNRPVDLRGGDGVQFGSHVLRVNMLGAPIRAQRTQKLAKQLLPLDRFDVVGEIGAGAFGKVLSAVRVSDGRKVAVKIMLERLSDSQDDWDRFIREGKIGQKLKNPHIVEVFEHIVVDRRACIVMELIEGPSLRDRMAVGQCALPDVLKVGVHMAHALTAAAELGIVNRDVKPANILMHPDGRAMLTDFGIAKDLETTMASLTKTGEGLGTLAYMAPEQVYEAKEVDPRADLYALGATLYRMLAGEAPFEIKGPADLPQLFVKDVPPVQEKRADCPPALAELVHALLAREPDDRPAVWKLAERFEALA